MTQECFFPWFVASCVQELEDNLLKPHFTAFEWGSGKSTIWLLRRVNEVVSIEHDKDWFRKVSQWLHLEEKGYFTLLHLDLDLYGGYVDEILKYPDEHFNVILIDGRKRSECIKASVNKVKPGGFVVVDDSEREQYQEAYKVFDGWRRQNWFDHTGKGTSIFFND
jgi:predicted O-methyltransferase YrrM